MVYILYVAVQQLVSWCLFAITTLALSVCWCDCIGVICPVRYMSTLFHAFVVGVGLICLRSVYEIRLLILVIVTKKDANGITKNIIESWYDIINAYDIL